MFLCICNFCLHHLASFPVMPFKVSHYGNLKENKKQQPSNLILFVITMSLNKWTKSLLCLECGETQKHQVILPCSLNSFSPFFFWMSLLLLFSTIMWMFFEIVVVLIVIFRRSFLTPNSHIKSFWFWKTFFLLIFITLAYRDVMMVLLYYI